MVAERRRDLVHRLPHRQRRQLGALRRDALGARADGVFCRLALSKLNDISRGRTACPVDSRHDARRESSALAATARRNAISPGSITRRSRTCRPTGRRCCSTNGAKASPPSRRFSCADTDGSDAVRLGEGRPLALSPDAQMGRLPSRTKRPPSDGAVASWHWRCQARCRAGRLSSISTGLRGRPTVDASSSPAAKRPTCDGPTSRMSMAVSHAP